MVFEGGGRLVLPSFSDALGRVTRWDPETGRERWHVDFRAGGGLCDIARAGGGRRVLAVAAEEGVSRFDAMTGAELASVWDVAAGVLPGGRAFVAGAGHNGKVFRWGAETGERVGEPVALGGDEDTPWLAPALVGGAARLFVAGTAYGTVREWDPVAGRRVRAVAPGISCAASPGPGAAPCSRPARRRGTSRCTAEAPAPA